jgi:prephenate dehydratase
VLDALVFQHELLLQREVVMAIHQHVLAAPGVGLADVRRLVTFPDALAQCQEFFARELPHVEIVAANSTAEAVKYVGREKPPGTAALGSSLAAKLYGLDVVAPEVEDHAENKTRFVVVAPDGIPARTGHDKTSVVCFQHSDRPGSLQAILGQFAARDINLTKLESRPTKHSLGDYCFIIDLEGHVDDAVVADCLHTLHAMLPRMKFLGSYPAAGEHASALRRDADASWRAADEWLSLLRGRVRR